MGLMIKAPFTSGAIQTRDRHGKVLTEFVGDFCRINVSNYHLVNLHGLPSG